MLPIVPIALKYLGYPCVHYSVDKLGNTIDGFTCSGFVNFILNEAAFIMPYHYTNELFDFFGVSVHDGLQKPGDLTFFSRSGIRPTHVEFYTTRSSIMEVLDSFDKEIKKDYISKILSSSKGKEFTIGSHGKTGTEVVLSKLERKIIVPDGKYIHIPQLYNQNPIGYKRQAMRVSGKRYQEMA